MISLINIKFQITDSVVGANGRYITNRLPGVDFPWPFASQSGLSGARFPTAGGAFGSPNKTDHQSQSNAKSALVANLCTHISHNAFYCYGWRLQLIMRHIWFYNDILQASTMHCDIDIHRQRYAGDIPLRHGLRILRMLQTLIIQMQHQFKLIIIGDWRLVPLFFFMRDLKMGRLIILRND